MAQPWVANSVGVNPDDPQWGVQRVEIGKFKTGYIYTFVYNRYQYDRTPLALVFAWEPMYATWLGINFHYVAPRVRMRMMSLWINNRWTYNPKEKRFALSNQLLKLTFKNTSQFLRRYKASEIRFPHIVPPEAFLAGMGRAVGGMMPAQKMVQVYNQSYTAINVSPHLEVAPEAQVKTKER